VTVGKHSSDRIELFPRAVLPEHEPTQELEDDAMKSRSDSQPPFPVRDYSSAVQSAVSWLGDRYLLAAPIHAASRPSHLHGRRTAVRLSVKQLQ
jgi:hypothetical protein